MNKLTATALCLGLFATSAGATSNEEFKADLAYCQEQADIRANADRFASSIPNAISGGANVIGAIIGGYNPGPALSGAAQGTIHGAANDARAREWRRQALIDACLREKQNARRSR